MQGKLLYPSRSAPEEEERPKDQYEGELQAGVRQGSGIYTWANGAVYTGHYDKNMRQGQGVMQYPGGAKYEGVVSTKHYVFQKKLMPNVTTCIASAKQHASFSGCGW